MMTVLKERRLIYILNNFRRTMDDMSPFLAWFHSLLLELSEGSHAQALEYLD